MNHESRSVDADAGTLDREDRSSEPPEIDDGRYVYCVVAIEDDSPFEPTGIENEPVYVVTADGVGAVVHACDEVYDSADLTEIHGWLVRHQSVVDAAAETFGTPLPFQFDTIFRGDDRTVRSWLDEHREEIARILDSLAGHWEYRIDVRRTEPIDSETLESGDDHLADLRQEIEDAEPGRRYLLESKYDDRIQRLRSDRNTTLIEEVRERLSDCVREVHEVEDASQRAVEGLSNSSETGDGQEADTKAVESSSIGRLTVLAHEDDEADVGAVLDDVAERPDIAVRFTGPWPPYSFTPTFGEQGDGESAEG